MFYANGNCQRDLESLNFQFYSKQRKFYISSLSTLWHGPVAQLGQSESLLAQESFRSRVRNRFFAKNYRKPRRKSLRVRTSLRKLE